MTELAVFVALAVLAGRWLDEKLDTKPVFLLISCLAAFAVSLYRLVGEASPPGPSTDAKPEDPDP